MCLRGKFSTSRHYVQHREVPGTNNQEIFTKKILSIENSMHSALLSPKLAQSLSCYLSFTMATSKPQNLQQKYIIIKTSKIKPSKLKARKTDDQNNLKAWVDSQVALCLLSLAQPSYVRLTSAQPQTTACQQKFHDPELILCWLQTCSGLMLLELTVKINLHSLPIHLESTSLRVH